MLNTEWRWVKPNKRPKNSEPEFLPQHAVALEVALKQSWRATNTHTARAWFDRQAARARSRHLRRELQDEPVLDWPLWDR